jgi:hypothetical protein
MIDSICPEKPQNPAGANKRKRIKKGRQKTPCEEIAKEKERNEEKSHMKKLAENTSKKEVRHFP